jgi:DNA (cytosine-5)-methyltransferase 1
MRSVCIICKSKRERTKMVQHGQHWTCLNCLTGVTDLIHDRPKVQVLNLYAGVGGNRWLWPDNLEVTAVEYNPKVAAEYKRNFPLDHVIIGDAHSYLLKNYKKFHIVWGSPPCQSHTKMNFIFDNKRYADLGLYQEIILLANFYQGLYVIENVRPYYKPLVPAQFEICRHLFWTNVPHLNDVILPEFPEQYRGRYKGINIMPKQAICDWLGIVPGQKNIYLTGKSSEQVYRNCVHPLLGQSIMNDILKAMTGERAAG